MLPRNKQCTRAAINVFVFWLLHLCRRDIPTFIFSRGKTHKGEKVLLSSWCLICLSFLCSSYLLSPSINVQQNQLGGTVGDGLLKLHGEGVHCNFVGKGFDLQMEGVLGYFLLM